MQVQLPALRRAIETVYKIDHRVRWQTPSSPPDVLVAILDDDEDNLRIVQAVPGRGFVVRGAVNPDATLKDPGDRHHQRPWVFDSVDKALYAVLGAPQ